MYLLTQSKNSISGLGLARQLGVRPDTAALMRHKLMSVMFEREGSRKLDGLPAVTAPADRPACEQAMRELYDIANHPPPPVFRWHADPYAMLFEAAMDKAAGPSIHRKLERSPAVLLDNLGDSPSLQRLKQLVSRRIHPLHVAATGTQVALISGPASEGAGVQIKLDQPAGLVAQLPVALASLGCATAQIAASNFKDPHEVFSTLS